MHASSGFVAFLLLALAACEGSDPAYPSTPESLTSSASSSSSGTATPVTPAPGAIPTSANEMNAWLHTKAYLGWAKESEPHPSAGPHASSVLTFVNPALEASLTSGAAEHPVGAAAVKEFLGASGVKGWAVYVKTETGEDGKSWYWYETFSATPGTHGIQGQGAPICVNCHASGKDFVLTPFPLR